MASIYSLKPGFQNLLRPAVKCLARIGVSANQITIAALILSLGAGAFIAWSQSNRALLVLPSVLLVRMALNAIDGMLAREHHQQSATGAVLNELGDVISDIALYLPLAVVPGFPPWTVVAIVILSLLTEMTGVLGIEIGASRRYDGPLGKSDRAFLFGVMGLLFGSGAHIESAIPLIVTSMVVMLAITIGNRVRNMLLEVSRGGSAK
jgi:CDP-diacylglycerol---glycerol-3-phosphate 3-phosphatidyltransferase